MSLNLVVIKNGVELVNMRIGFGAFSYLRIYMAKALSKSLGKEWEQCVRDSLFWDGKGKRPSVKYPDKLDIEVTMKEIETFMMLLSHPDCGGIITWQQSRILYGLLSRIGEDKKPEVDTFDYKGKETFNAFLNVLRVSSENKRMVEFI